MSIAHDITFHPSWWHKNAGIDFSAPFFDDPAYRIDCDVKMRRCLYDHFGDLGIGEEKPQPRPLLGSDLLAAGYLHSQILGCDIVYQPDNSPQVVCRELGVGEIGAVEAPNLDQNPVWQGVQRQIDWLLEKYGHVDTYINLMGIQNIGIDLMGQEILMAYYSDEDAVRGLLEEIYKLVRDVGGRFRALSGDVSGGVTRIMRQVMPDCYLTSNCSVDMISGDTYEEFLLEYDQRLARDFRRFGIHHCGKTMEHLLDGYGKVAGLDFAEVGAGSDLAAVRARFPEMMLNARYSPVDLTKQGEVEIRETVGALYAAGNVPGKNLFSISCVGMDVNVPDENIRIFLDACSTL